MTRHPDTALVVLGQEPDGTPRVAAYRSRDGLTLVITCPYCRHRHSHGAVSPARGAGNGHRLAHCADRPPLAPGYVLVEVSAPRIGREARTHGRTV